MRKYLAVALIGLGLAVSAQAQAGDAAAGKAKSGTCVACHGANGVSPAPTFPNLAGQKAQYLIDQMKAFRSKARDNAIMAPMAAGLSDEDIADLAAFYSSQSCN